MSRTWLLIGASLALGLTGIMTACEKSPAAPTLPPVGGSGTPTATRLEITGPRAIVPGIPAQFTATVHMSDGSSRDVTTSASWRSPWVGFVVSAPGLLTAQQNGTIDLSAVYAGLTSTREVIAVPEGTFRLTGTVTDVTAPAGPVESAQLKVTDGTGRGLFASTGPDGRYFLYGVAGDIELRVTKHRYRDPVQRVVVTDHQTLDVDLPIAAPLPDVSGSWVLTITAADTCSSVLPEEAMSRKYSAMIRQVGPDVRIELGGARFARVHGWTADGVDHATVWPDNLQFGLGPAGCDPFYYGCGLDVMEELAPSRFYLPTGFVAVSISSTVLSGKLDGEIGTYTLSAPDTFSREASCRSSRHQVTFTK